MEVNSNNWHAVKLSLATGASGLVIGAYMLVNVYGYVDPLRVQRLVASASDAAVLRSLARRCAEEFRALPDRGDRMVSLVDGVSVHQRAVIPADLITRPGAKDPDDDLAQACVALLLREPA